MYGVPLTISGDAYKGEPQNVDNRDVSLKTFDRPKSAICEQYTFVIITISKTDPYRIVNIIDICTNLSTTSII